MSLCRETVLYANFCEWCIPTYHIIFLLDLKLGIGTSSKFPGAEATEFIYSPRLFKGNIRYVSHMYQSFLMDMRTHRTLLTLFRSCISRYDVISITDSPTDAPQTSTPSKPPSSPPTPNPTALPSIRTTSPFTSSSPVVVDLPHVKQIRIHAVTGHPIQLLEVEVFSSGVNVALNKPALQSSTLKSMAASRAVDGSKETFSHTTSESTFSWWEVDLEGSFPIDSVTIWNRYCQSPDDPRGCLCRLSYAVVSFFNGEGQWIATTSVGDTCGKLQWTHRFSGSSESDACSWNNLV